MNTECHHDNDNDNDGDSRMSHKFLHETLCVVRNKCKEQAKYVLDRFTTI